MPNPETAATAPAAIAHNQTAVTYTRLVCLYLVPGVSCRLASVPRDLLDTAPE